MTKLYRLVRAARAEEAFSGEGARLFGGRWNPPGRPVVYASESRALAVLEAFVHLATKARSMRFLLYTITLPRGTRLKRYGRALLSKHTSTSTFQQAGREWIDEAASLALVVPSIIVPQEANYVLNVRHPQFPRLQVAEPEAFSFDERLWQSTQESGHQL